jgi:hypothetical protein
VSYGGIIAERDDRSGEEAEIHGRTLETAAISASTTHSGA